MNDLKEKENEKTEIWNGTNEKKCDTTEKRGEKVEEKKEK